MTSNSQLKRKNIELRMRNDNLLDLRLALMSDNRRLESECDEARAWARRMMKERDEYRERCVELEERLDIGTGNLADIEPPQFVKDAQAEIERLTRERDEALEALRDEKNKVNYAFRLGIVVPPGKWIRWSGDVA